MEDGDLSVAARRRNGLCVDELKSVSSLDVRHDGLGEEAAA